MDVSFPAFPHKKHVLSILTREYARLEDGGVLPLRMEEYIMYKKIILILLLSVLVSTGYGQVMIGDFETGISPWAAGPDGLNAKLPDCG